MKSNDIAYIKPNLGRVIKLLVYLNTGSMSIFSPMLSANTFSSIQPNIAVGANVPSNKLGRGLNLGGTMEGFEGGVEGGLIGSEADSYRWAYPLKADYFSTIKKAGFQHVRLPISWSTSKPGTRYDTLTLSPYTINPQLFARVDWAVQQALKNGLAIILDNHNVDDPIHKDPDAEEVRFLAIWQQIAEHYKSQPNTVYFELLNEPSDTLGQDVKHWNTLLNKAIKVIRQSNATRSIIVGSAWGNSPWALPQLDLPKNDHNLIASFHFYEPFAFTHQGVDWITPAWPTGINWTGLKPTFIMGAYAMGFGSWSDQTKVTLKTANTLAINFSAWGGIYFNPYSSLVGFNSLSFKTSNAGLKLEVLCNDQPDSPENIGKTISTLPGLRTYTIGFSECRSPSIFNFFKMGINSNQPVLGVNLQNLELNGTLGKLPLVTTETGQIQATFDYIAAWAKLNNRPVYMGEFGTYEKSETVDAGKSRTNWAKAVRLEAEKRSFSWAYWDFGSGGECKQQTGFGIYVRAINRPNDCVEAAKWKTNLLDALTH